MSEFWDNAEMVGHAAMCVRIKLRKDQKGQPADQRHIERIERGEKALALLYERIKQLEATEDDPPPDAASVQARWGG